MGSPAIPERLAALHTWQALGEDGASGGIRTHDPSFGG